MDCEKFESTMLDELYDELDELTSAAAKRHVAGCARCASLFSGLRATRRVAVMPLVEPPPDLEDKILAAARHAQKVVPLRSRVARVVSAAGSWAMRPQTAMVAVFLLMIGSSFMLLRVRHANKSASSGAVTVSQVGAPAPQSAASAAPTMAALDDNAPAPAPARAEKKGGDDLPADGLAMRDKDYAAKELSRREHAKAALENDEERGRGNIANAGPIAGVPYSGGMLPPAPAAADRADPMLGAAGETQQGQAQAAAGAGGGQGAGFNAAMSAYNAQRFGDAYRMFNALAPTDVNAALYAARSLQQVSGCSAAVSRYDDVAQRASGTRVGWDATLEGGRCYRIIGNAEAARARLRPLLSVPGYGSLAQQELDLIDNAVASRAAPASPPPAATATTSPPAQATPPAASKPPERSVDTGYSQ